MVHCGFVVALFHFSSHGKQYLGNSEGSVALIILDQEKEGGEDISSLCIIRISSTTPIRHDGSFK